MGVPQPEALPAEYGCNLDFSAPSSDSGTVCGMVISETPATKYLLAGDFYLAPVIYSKAKLEDGSEIDIPFVSLNVGSDKVADIKTESGGFVFLDVPPGEYGVVIYTPVQSFLFHDGAGQNTLMFEIVAGEVNQLRPNLAGLRTWAMTAQSKPTILIVDDEPRMVRFVKMNLDLEGYLTLEANNGMQALEKVRNHQPDLVLLDVEMPGMDGFETLHRIREVSDAPVIMLTVRSDEDDRIKGLDLGADDYITKPFSPRELSSRIRAVLRRFEQPGRLQDQIIAIDDRLQVDLQRRQVIVDGERIGLRPTEYRLLYHLIQNAGWVVPHETLLTKVWGHEYIDDNHLLRLYITYLRQKIEPDLANPRYIFTERGLGYRFVDYRRELRDEME